MKKLFPLFILLSSFMSCSSKLALPTIDNVDINQYQGKRYEIARLPNNFEKGLNCVTAEYTIKTNGKVNVLNKDYQLTIRNGNRVKVRLGHQMKHSQDN